MTPDRRDELALRVVSVVVVGSLAVALAGLTWRLTGWDDGRSEVAVAETLPPLGTAGAAGAGTDVDVARIIGLAPFGGGPTGGGGLPGSSSGLVLKGVLMAEPATASTALIAVGEGPAAIYGVGQGVADAIVEAIAMDHVILVVGGVRQRLDFPAPVAGMAPPPSGASGAGITIAPVGPAMAPTTGTPQAPSPASGPNQAGGQGGSGPAPSAPVAPVSPATLGVTGTAGGYRVGDNPSAELRRFGLQPGDIIETLNGQPVGNAASDQQLFERARSAGQARVVVVRDGRRLTLNFPLR
ncbi:MAG: type II secretion system protein N [Brevundimonas sp.]|uniref:type II secretion system protein N n=1 Tax=Brevundimonas sp. TaxID=1871086 RepID=UPI00273740AC|nr:type II secretion system protein N [Brevundimonas sp.]MDP3403152.1 type II secretion system protein N [Brevundimonas sp.]